MTPRPAYPCVVPNSFKGPWLVNVPNPMTDPFGTRHLLWFNALFGRFPTDSDVALVTTVLDKGIHSFPVPQDESTVDQLLGDHIFGLYEPSRYSDEITRETFDTFRFNLQSTRSCKWRRNNQ